MPEEQITPASERAAIAMELLKSSESDMERDSGTPSFREPLDMVVGVTEQNKENLLCFRMDRRRFRPFDG